MILYTFALYNNFTFSSSRSSFLRQKDEFFFSQSSPLFWESRQKITRIIIA